MDSWALHGVSHWVHCHRLIDLGVISDTQLRRWFDISHHAQVLVLRCRSFTTQFFPLIPTSLRLGRACKELSDEQCISQKKQGMWVGIKPEVLAKLPSHACFMDSLKHPGTHLQHSVVAVVVV